MNVGFTGHRNCKTPDWLYHALNDAVKRAAESGARWFVSGGSMGRDVEFLEAAMVERWRHAGKPNTSYEGMFDVRGLPDGIVVMAMLPFRGYWNHYKDKISTDFDVLEKQLDVVGYIDGEGGYDVAKIHARNRWIVDESDIVMTVYDGRQGGGTYSTLRYAKKKHKPILWLNPVEETEKWIRFGVDYG